MQRPSLPRKNKRASNNWKLKTDTEKSEFRDSAKDYKKVNTKEVTEEQKRTLIDRHRKKLLEEEGNYQQCVDDSTIIGFYSLFILLGGCSVFWFDIKVK